MVENIAVDMIAIEAEKLSIIQSVFRIIACLLVRLLAPHFERNKPNQHKALWHEYEKIRLAAAISPTSICDAKCEMLFHETKGNEMNLYNVVLKPLMQQQELH